MADAQTWTHSFTATMPAAMEAIRWLDHAARLAQGSDDDVYALQVCFEEIVTNVIRHNAAQTPEITATFKGEGNRLTLVIEDTGAAFDITEATPRRAAGPLDDLEPGGLGIQLIRSFSSELHYRRFNDRNEATVVLNRSNPHSELNRHDPA